MATKRMIKTSLPKSKKMRRLKDDTTRLLFYMLCVSCDDDAKMDADPEDIRADLFGGRDKIKIQDVNKMLTNLAEQGLIVFYQDKITKETYLSIPCWLDTNVIPEKRHKASVLPCFSEESHTLLAECIHNVNKCMPSIEENRVVKSSIEEKSKVSLSQASLTLGRLFLNCIIKENDKSKLCVLSEGKKIEQSEKWAEDIDKIMRIDGREQNDIRDIIYFATSDDFWKGNILSAAKLRKQFDQLYVKMQNPKKVLTAAEIENKKWGIK